MDAKRLVGEEPNCLKLALHGAVDRRSVAVDHLSWDTMTTTPHSHTTRHFDDQAVGGGNFRGALRSVHRGSLHVHAEHYRESRSEAHPGQSLYVYFHRTSPLYSLIDPNPSDDREWELTVAHFGPFSNFERCLPCTGPTVSDGVRTGHETAGSSAFHVNRSSGAWYHDKEFKTSMGIVVRDQSRGSHVRR